MTRRHQGTVRVARLSLALGVALGGCHSSDPDREALEERLAACATRLAKLEEDDRYLFAEGAADLERGWATSACTRFETLVNRFPSSPLVTEAKTRMERCKGTTSKSAASEPAANARDGTGTESARTESAAATRPAAAAAAAADSEASGDGSPIEVNRSWIKEDRFGVPLAQLRLANRSDKTIVGYKVGLRCYDDRGTVVKHLTKATEWFVAAGGSRQAGPGEAFAGGPWALTGFLGTTRVEAVVLNVDYADGSSWQRENLTSLGDVGLSKE